MMKIFPQITDAMVVALAAKYNFASPVFSNNVPRTNVKTTNEGKIIRNTVFEGDTDDSALVGIVRCLQSFPDISEACHIPGQDLPLDAFIPEGLKEQGASLQGSGRGPAKFLVPQNSWPLCREVGLFYADERNGVVTCGRETQVVMCGGSETMFFVDWPLFSGVTGSLKLTPKNPWAQGFIYKIRSAPGQFSAKALIEKLFENENDLLLLFSSTGMDTAWFSATLPEERVAVVAASLILEVKDYGC
jgi:hypothetical protein